MKNNILYLASFILMLSVIPVNVIAQKDFPGFKKTESGLYYKVLKAGDQSQKPVAGDILTLDLYYTNDKDSVIFDSRKNPQKFMIPLAVPMYPADINEAMSLLALYDSTLFLLDADSFFIKTVGLPEAPEFVTKGSKLYFTMTLKAFMKEAEYEKLVAEQKAAEKERAEIAKKEEGSKIMNYITEQGITVKPRESGLYYIIVDEGKGVQAVPGNTVKVHYTGTFLNGEKFDSSLDRGQPIEFVLGQGRVIKGWDEGIALMKKGGKAKFVIPSHIAYGERGGGAIPPFTPLVFEVELVDVIE